MTFKLPQDSLIDWSQIGRQCTHLLYNWSSFCPLINYSFTVLAYVWPTAPIPPGLMAPMAFIKFIKIILVRLLFKVWIERYDCFNEQWNWRIGWLDQNLIFKSVDCAIGNLAAHHVWCYAVTTALIDVEGRFWALDERVNVDCYSLLSAHFDVLVMT